MKKSKFERILNFFREEMAANLPGGSSGFTSASDPKGPTAGYDQPITKMVRRKKYASLGLGSRTRWKTNPEKNNGRGN